MAQNNNVVTDALSGRTASVDKNGSLQTKIAGLVAAVVTDPSGDMKATVDTDGLHVKVTHTIEVKNAPVGLSGNAGGAVTDDGTNEIVPQNALRRSLVLSNSGANAIYVKFGGTASTTDLIIAPGQQLVLTNPPTSAIKARCGTGLGSHLAAMETEDA